MADLDEEGASFKVAKGGNGGQGNYKVILLIYANMKIRKKICNKCNMED